MFVAELTESFKEYFRQTASRSDSSSRSVVALWIRTSKCSNSEVFFCGALGQFLAIAGFDLPFTVMIIAGFVPLFFDNASIAVYTKTTEVIKAAMILPLSVWNHSGIR